LYQWLVHWIKKIYQTVLILLIFFIKILTRKASMWYYSA